MKEIMTLKEAAKFLNIGTTTLREKIKDKSIPYFKLKKRYRFSRSSLEQWIGDQEELNRKE